MMGKEIDPSDIGKHPKVIRIAQNDMTQTDVLVCGKCHSVFHFIEIFQEHKDIGCEKDSSFKDCRETKPKVWAFLLWKASQLNAIENAGNVNSWQLYQTWVKMDDSIRETWVVAGKTIQSFARMGQGNLQEMPVKITKTVVDNTPRAMSTPKPPLKTVDNKQMFKKDISTDNEDEMSPIRTDQGARIIRKPVSQFNQTKTPPGNAIISKTIISRRANRTIPNTSGQEFEEETVEKIIAKRFNPRRKMHEYLVKWEGFPHDQNTWEPQTHLESCPQLLDTFEKQLARQKEQRAAQAAKQTVIANQPQLPVKPASPLSPSLGRPARHSKAKAMDQVKQWCADEDSGPMNTSKRKHEDSDFDESGAGGDDDEDDFDEDDVQAHVVKKLKNGNSVAVKMDSKNDVRISQLPITIIKAVNGNVKSPINESSAEVIITKNQSGIHKKVGVVSTSSHKTEAQIRVLSKGENTASGIVRINTANKVPVSGLTAGQTRITQVTQRSNTLNNSTPTIKTMTQQKMLSNASTPIPRSLPMQSKVVHRTTIQSPNTNQHTAKAVINRVTKVQQQQQQASKAVTPEQKIIQLSKSGDLKVTRKVIHSAPAQSSQQQIATNKIVAHNDLPDDPFPEPQSPPRPLTLCPITGKVLGQAEGEPAPVPSPEALKKEYETSRRNVTTVGILQTSEPQASHTQDQDTAEELSKGIAIAATEDGQTQQILANEDGTPLLVTGDDGTIYQVAGKNAEGQTILIAQGADGEQQYAYVAADDGDEGGVLTLDNAVAEAVAQMLPEQQAETLAGGQTQYILKQQDDSAVDGTTDATESLTIQTGDAGDSQDGNIPAEVVQADLPSPGGTRRVVLLLQDGTFMMTEMHDDEYQALNIVT